MLYRTRVLIIAAVALVASVGCSEERSEPTPTTDESTATCSPDDLFACAQESSIAHLLPDEPTAADGEPIVIGMVNQVDSPAGAYPELNIAAQAFIDWINTEAGGVDGRPIELEVCNTGFSAEGSTACGQQFVQSGAPVVLGGIDVFGNAIDTLRDNGIPYVGGIPVSVNSMQSDNSFQFSGGTWGAAVAFAYHAAEVTEAESVSVVYGEFGSIATGAEYAEETLRSLGVDDVTTVPYPIVSTDLSSPMQAAWASEPDAMIVLAADAGCNAAFDAAHTIGVDATLYFVGACASPSIVDQVDVEVLEGTWFNVEGPVDRQNPSPDFIFYDSVLAAAAPELAPASAATVSARSVMNLWAKLSELGADNITPDAITEAFRTAVDEPSFTGHPYTCDGKQFGTLTAACSPQQIMVHVHNGVLTQSGDWIDVGAIHPG